jgi:hypothetical protein
MPDSSHSARALNTSVQARPKSRSVAVEPIGICDRIAMFHGDDRAVRGRNRRAGLARASTDEDMAARSRTGPPCLIAEVLMPEPTRGLAHVASLGCSFAPAGWWKPRRGQVSPVVCQGQTTCDAASIAGAILAGRPGSWLTKADRRRRQGCEAACHPPMGLRPAQRSLRAWCEVLAGAATLWPLWTLREDCAAGVVPWRRGVRHCCRGLRLDAADLSSGDPIQCRRASTPSSCPAPVCRSRC